MPIYYKYGVCWDWKVDDQYKVKKIMKGKRNKNKRFMKLTAVLLTVAMTAGSNGFSVAAAQTDELFTYEAEEQLVLAEDESSEDDPLKTPDYGLLEETVSYDQVSGNTAWDEDIEANESMVEEESREGEDIPSEYNTWRAMWIRR